jgi:hypothetical protein
MLSGLENGPGRDACLFRRVVFWQDADSLSVIAGTLANGGVYVAAASSWSPALTACDAPADQCIYASPRPLSGPCETRSQSAVLWCILAWRCGGFVVSFVKAPHSGPTVSASAAAAAAGAVPTCDAATAACPVARRCPVTGDRVFKAATVRDCLSLMYSCGMYDYSGEFAFRIGFPSKSGVSGAMMVVIPNKMVCIRLLEWVIRWAVGFAWSCNSVRRCTSEHGGDTWWQTRRVVCMSTTTYAGNGTPDAVHSHCNDKNNVNQTTTTTTTTTTTVPIASTTIAS